MFIGGFLALQSYNSTGLDFQRIGLGPNYDYNRFFLNIYQDLETIVLLKLAAEAELRKRKFIAKNTPSPHPFHKKEALDLDLDLDHVD